MSYKYGLNGNDIEWGNIEHVLHSPKCMDGCKHDDDICEGHTIKYSQRGWAIFQDTNSNFVSTSGHVPMYVFTTDYLIDEYMDYYRTSETRKGRIRLELITRGEEVKLDKAFFRFLASEWYNGQHSALYAYSSTETVQDGLLGEIEYCISLTDTTKQERKELKRFHDYISTKVMPPTCIKCKKEPAELIEYRHSARVEKLTPDEFVRQHEGTYNPDSNKFYCTSCYVSVGMP